MRRENGFRRHAKRRRASPAQEASASGNAPSSTWHHLAERIGNESVQAADHARRKLAFLIPAARISACLAIR
jgi:hypothetical protein